VLSHLCSLLKEKIKDQCEITGIFIGTTQATNAILQGTDLYKVGLIRIAGHNPQTISPAYTWPEKIREVILAGSVNINGGFECDGREITKFNTSELLDAIDTLIAQGAQSLSLVGVFSSLYNTHENIACELIKQKCGNNFPVTCSYKVGGLGFIERENATILNSALKKNISKHFGALVPVCEKFTQAPVYITQNNGTIMTLEQACEFPVLTIAAGPTNSFVGGALLGKKENTVVVDIGGTSTDVGLIQNGFARRSLYTSNIGGIALNFPMPDVLSIACGGGSHITLTPQIKIGPNSCAHELFIKACVFGGDTLTLTDCAISAGTLDISGANKSLIGISKSEAQVVLSKAQEEISDLITRIKGPHKDLPVILVGGGAALFNKNSFLDQCEIPEHFDVANAYGAACARIAATIDTVISLDKRDETLETLCAQASSMAESKGAQKETISIVQKEIIPYFYIPGNKARVIITAAGKRT
jgi:N-methylhydantoinase A/oxoprolinase/acetone carboxylase beta subunit